jgi:eukaryotic-like serine/threonine-protein kinase
MDFTILQCLQVLEDVELYQARTTNEAVVALKIGRSGFKRQLKETFDREGLVLRHLDGCASPRLLESGEHEERPYLVIEWCTGKSADRAASDIRSQGGPQSREMLFDLCLAVLDAYVRLHARGVIHSDVHPRNLVVTAQGQVKVIDYGLSRIQGLRGKIRQPKRGGVAFFYEPEYAAAECSGKPAPASSEFGEQYALGALLYLLITGLHYRDFSLEKGKMLRQIADDAPMPFSNRGVMAWPEVESILATALRKNPRERFPSLRAFRRCFASVLDVRRSPGAWKTAPITQDSPDAKALLTTCLQRVSIAGLLLPSGLPFAPTASVSYGAAGIAYALYRLACVREDASLLFTADAWANRAERDSGKPGAFYNKEIDVAEEVVGKVSPYHTESGLHCVTALISHAMGDSLRAQESVHAFVDASSHPCANPDLTLGRSGLLVAAALIVDAFSRSEVDTSRVVAFGDQTASGIWSELDCLGPIQEAVEVQYSGMAHGWAGFLFSALRWSSSSGSPVLTGIRRRLSELAECAESVGQSARWRAWIHDGHRPTKHSYQPGWCNGSAGFVQLWTLAHEVLGDDAFLSLAERAALHCWETRNQIANLCCGLAGEAYALLHLFRRTGDRAWLLRADDLASRAVVGCRDHNSWRDSRYAESLYKGDLGVALLTAELSRPESACMPFFAAEGWPTKRASAGSHADSLTARESDLPQNQKGHARHGI